MTNALHAEIARNQQLVTSNLESDVQAPDFWKTRVRVLARADGQTVDISSLCDNLTWQDQSSDNLANINSQAAMTGSIVLHKPNLRDYSRLAPLIFPGESFSARVSGATDNYMKPGAMGSVIICQVGYGNTFQNIWAMRVVPGYNSDQAESITMSDGSWTLMLADDLWQAAQTVADFQFSKGKKTRTQGWRAHEVAAVLCQRYRIPVRTLCQGTAYFALAPSQTTLTSPMHVITEAYHEETIRTGRTFIIRWGAPDKKYPFGALEVVPMRRNRLLYAFRDQLIDATLSRSQSADFATIVEARGQVANGKTTRKITYSAYNGAAMRRYGWVRKTINFGKVSSEAELAVLAKRALAVRLTPLRQAELTHPGIATIRRGDACRINIPEEGYSNVKLTAYETPTTTGTPKVQAAALRAAETMDPSLFGMADPALAWGLGDNPDAGTSTNQSLDANVPAILPVADQGIVYVTTAVHTVASGQYTMDLTMGFINVLDPGEVRSQVDQAVRNWKAQHPKG